MDTDGVVKAVTPVFACGFAVQQLLVLLDPAITAIVKTPATKKVVAGIISLAIGLLLAAFGGFHVVTTLSGGNWNHPSIDVFVTALILSAGTEGFNSIMKFMGYAKDNKKAEAATNTNSAPKVSLGALNRGQGLPSNTTGEI